MDIETCVAPVEDLLHKGEADELFQEKQGEDLMGEDLLDDLVMETTDTVEDAIRGCGFLLIMTVADLGVGIPCGKKAKKVGSQSHKSIDSPYREGIADHGHHCHVVEEEIGPQQPGFSEIQLQDVVE